MLVLDCDVNTQQQCSLGNDGFPLQRLENTKRFPTARRSESADQTRIQTSQGQDGDAHQRFTEALTESHQVDLSARAAANDYFHY